MTGYVCDLCYQVHVLGEKGMPLIIGGAEAQQTRNYPVILPCHFRNVSRSYTTVDVTDSVF